MVELRKRFNPPVALSARTDSWLYEVFAADVFRMVRVFAFTADEENVAAVADRRMRSDPSVPRVMTPFKSAVPWAPEISMKDCLLGERPPPALKRRKPLSAAGSNDRISPTEAVLSRLGREVISGAVRETPPLNVLNPVTARLSRVMSFAVKGAPTSTRPLKRVKPSTVSAADPSACSSMSTSRTKRTMAAIVSFP